MSATTSPVQPPTRTILLVEDEESVRQVTRSVLESAGYLVLEASSAEQAISVFRHREGSIDLLLTDVVMPGMSGTELAGRLKAMHPGFVTVFMSGYPGNPRLSQPGLGTGGYFIQKPFSMNVLLSRVADACNVPLKPQASSSGSTRFRI